MVSDWLWPMATFRDVRLKADFHQAAGILRPLSGCMVELAQQAIRKSLLAKQSNRQIVCSSFQSCPWCVGQLLHFNAGSPSKVSNDSGIIAADRTIQSVRGYFLAA